MATVADKILFIITGDNSGLIKATGQSDAAIGKMTSRGGTNLRGLLLGFLGVTSAVAAMTAALKFAVSQSLESERVFALLAASIKAAGGNWEEQEKAVNAFLLTLQKTSTFTKEEGAQALQVLTEAGMDLVQAESLMAIMADAATARGMKLADVAEILGAAFQGNARGARQLGIVLSETADPAKVLGDLLDKMNERFSGANQANLKTTIGQWKEFKNVIGEAAQAVGDFIARGVAGWRALLGMMPPPSPIGTDLLAARGIPTSMFAAHGAQIATPSKDVIKKQAEEQAKIIADAQKKYDDQVAKARLSNYIEYFKAIHAGYKKEAEDELKRIEDEKQKRELAINALIDNSHRLASEFGRFMGQAVENFVHNAIEGIATIKGNLAAVKAGGIGGAAGVLGLAGAAVGIIGSFVDAFFKGSEKIFKSNVEVVQAIQNWISSLRSQTKEELVAGRKDIEAGRKALKEAAGFSGDLLKKNSDEFIASLSDSSFKQTFAAAAEQFKRTTGRRGSVEEVLAFMEQQLIKQERLFDALVGGKVKSPDDVRALLKDQTRLDAQTGRMWIEFIAKQNNWTPAEQKALFEELFNTLADSGNASVQELMALRETIDALEQGTANISEEGDKQIQITRSVAGITENSANLVVGHLSTINAVVQGIYELLQRAMDNFTSAAAGIPAMAGGGVTFEAGSIVIESSAANGKQLAEEFTTSLRAKGVKV